ncbi:PspA/IM30 family protein [Rhabdochromatium marinum]|uniref:PspA/IM30 family protein n=1 Tax=Rhabdochromatium marinum TaxID=48729 RepID=UPI001904FA6B|nr:PspA/IM30 family protein [Rhabdochromatium marinum]MBK1648574.1 hypothetical protein [Rhabdochromatium marinum]
MAFWSKLVTAVRGAVNEAGEAAVDSQAFRILDQEIRDAEEALGLAKQDLAAVMAEHMGVERRVQALQESITQHEGYAMQALDKGEDLLAGEIAGKIAEFEQELAAQSAIMDGFTENIRQLKHSIRQTERNIKAMRREVHMIKATEAVQNANDAITTRHAGATSAATSASETLARIKSRQQQRADRAAAARTLHQEEQGADLHAKLQAAGITPSGTSSAHDILARLKQRGAAKT